MTNDLKNFLENEQEYYTQHNFLSDGIVDDLKWLNKHDTRLINFVLDLVDRKIKEKYHCDTEEEQQLLSTIINNLRV